MTNPTFLSSSSLLALTVSLVACGGSFRVVDVAPRGGELALEGERGQARAEAESYISRHCPFGHDVVHDGLALIGMPAQTVRPYGSRDASLRGGETEWRVHYRCSEQPAAPLPIAERPAPEPAATSTPAPAAAPEPAPSPAATPEPTPAPRPAAPPSPPANNWL
ncbi:MAG TPA: hypothetical protein VFS43_45175 [Polyangiaceae bacterium]|nr:hypothetical protein [Polyangiaceae bacterium]